MRTSFDAVDVRRIDDLNLDSAELRDDRFHAVRIVDAFGQRLVEIVVGDVPLFFGELDELANLLLQCLMEVLRR